MADDPAFPADPTMEEVRLWRFPAPGEGGHGEVSDRVAVEEPLTIRLATRDDGERPPSTKTVAVTLRTPGADEELALGFLHAEGVVRDLSLVDAVSAWTETTGGARADIAEVRLRVRRLPELRHLDRHVVVSSACGLCGRRALDEMLLDGLEPPASAAETPALAASVLATLPERLREHQATFGATGGLHAAALVSLETGEIERVREDVGRHNAMDKLVGSCLRSGLLGPGKSLDRHLVLVSGRASFELVQKALAAGLPMLAAVSAPSSLAVEMAERFGMTLVGFLRRGRFNVYAAPERLDWRDT